MSSPLLSLPLVAFGSPVSSIRGKSEGRSREEAEWRWMMASCEGVAYIEWISFRAVEAKRKKDRKSSIEGEGARFREVAERRKPVLQ